MRILTVELLSRLNELVYLEVLTTVWHIKHSHMLFSYYCCYLSPVSQLQPQIFKQLSFVLPDYICGRQRRDKTLLNT